MPVPLSENSVTELRTQGLSVLLMENGRGTYLVLKPSGTPGNAIPGRQGWFKNEAGEQVFSDAPAVHVSPVEGEWEMRVHEWVPGPGPGDFRKRVASEQELLIALETYFFRPNPEFAEALESSQARARRK